MIKGISITSQIAPIEQNQEVGIGKIEESLIRPQFAIVEPKLRFRNLNREEAPIGGSIEPLEGWG